MLRSMLESFVHIAPALWLVPIGIVYVVGLWLLIDKITPFNDWEELFRRGNVALLCQRLGLLFGQLIALSAIVLKFDVAREWPSVKGALYNGAYVFVAMLFAYFVVDRIVLFRQKNVELLVPKDGSAPNVALGLVEGSFYIGIGFLLKGSLTGEAPSTWESVLSTVAFFVAGLIVALGVFWLHELATPYNLRDNLKNGDLSAAIELAGVFVGVSIVTKVGVAGDFYSWPTAFGWFFLTVVIGLVLLYALRLLFNWVLLHGKNTVREAQRSEVPATAAAFQAGVMVIAASVVAALLSF